MNSNEIAKKYGLFEIDVYKYIKDNAYFPIKENWYGYIIVPDEVDLETFFQPLLLEKKRKQKTTEDRLLKQQEESDNLNHTLHNEDTGVFANVGEKLKSWAKINFVLGVVLGVVIAIATIAIDEEFFLVGIGAGVMEILVAWAFSLVLYAFGELVANSKESKKIQQEILDELRNKNK